MNLPDDEAADLRILLARFLLGEPRLRLSRRGCQVAGSFPEPPSITPDGGPVTHEEKETEMNDDDSADRCSTDAHNVNDPRCDFAPDETPESFGASRSSGAPPRDAEDLDIRDRFGEPMTPPDKFGYDGGYLVIDGKRYMLIYREDAPEYPPFPCQDTGLESHPPHDWEAEQWPFPGWFHCPGWRGRKVNR